MVTSIFKAREAALSQVDTGVLQKGISILLEEGQNSPRSYGYGTPINITRRYIILTQLLVKPLKTAMSKKMMAGTTG